MKRKSGRTTMKKIFTMALALIILANFSGLASAAVTVKSAKSNSSYREASDNSDPKQMTGTVTQVNSSAKTFTVMVQGQAIIISAEKMTTLPQLGDNLVISYTQTLGGPPVAMPSCCVKGGKSNSSEWPQRVAKRQPNSLIYTRFYDRYMVWSSRSHNRNEQAPSAFVSHVSQLSPTFLFGRQISHNFRFQVIDLHLPQIGNVSLYLNWLSSVQFQLRTRVEFGLR